MQKIQSFDWLHFKLKFQIQIFKFSIQNKLLCLPVLLQNVFLRLINIFVFFVFILTDAFSDREITKNLFTLAENNFGERKLSCTRLNFGKFLFVGTKPAVLAVQYRSILPTRVANQNTEFAAYCLLAELAI